MARNDWTRREFLKASAAAAVLAWHAPLRAGQPAVAAARQVADEPRLSRLRLEATRLKEMRRFYTETFGLPAANGENDALVIRFGRTRIEFREATGEDEPFYHFAFNIPENKFARAKAWLAERCPLLRDSASGADEYFFEGWNAHAVYFQDPAGNIGELIARHTLANGADGPFGVEDILYASEIGLVSPDPDGLAAKIGERFDLKPYPSSFFMGDERGMFVLPPVGRPWIPERVQKAAIFPAEVQMNGHDDTPLRLPELPYVIRGIG